MYGILEVGAVRAPIDRASLRGVLRYALEAESTPQKWLLPVHLSMLKKRRNQRMGPAPHVKQLPLFELSVIAFENSDFLCSTDAREDRPNQCL